jgi:hypothetical protein
VSEWTNQTEASAITAPAPTLTDLLFFSGLSQTRWSHLSDDERADWTRRYIESEIEAGALERSQGRARK